jgi:hypothetical protein
MQSVPGATMTAAGGSAEAVPEVAELPFLLLGGGAGASGGAGGGGDAAGAAARAQLLRVPGPIFSPLQVRRFFADRTRSHNSPLPFY